MRPLFTLLLALALVAPALAHPPKGAKKGPSKATPILKQALDAKKKGDLKGYEAGLLAAKRILAEEGRFACCIKGGCAECALEGNCGCAANLFEKKGVCKTCLEGIKAGNGRYDNLTPDMLFEQLMELEMPGTLGPWSMSREGSGTSWLPESSPMYGRMSERGSWRLMQMGLAVGAFSAAGGTRGESQTYGASQYMLMGQKRDEAGRVLGLRGMFSLDALTNGQRGYPNLFQTGETAHGQPLQDRQHPHDLFMELGASYSAPLGGGARGFLYLAPVGEPALGPAAFQHRPSAWDNPVAPISHHWLDGSHITFGVATAGVTLADKWKLEGSVFNGREPGENRYNLDPIRLNSYSGRLTHNPTKDISIQASYGFLKSPEALEPGVDVHRLTVSLMHNRALENGDNLATLLALGQNLKHGDRTTALLAEAAYTHGRQTYFARVDSAQKDELVGVPSGVYRVQKLSLGGVHNLKQDEQGQQGIGASVDLYAYPTALKPAYGSAPVSVNLFYRWRFGKM
ncbi:hypothetical protein [Armatimonas rosea]|uniref:Uncharacterized protein n=1 Tax=Armatimonas rosea TaxID=685828 RepID=A0A7W9SRM9_ARMRO|nr:hypothetical protein [Armatimonas rosea]MBB6050803.1 hypothetical protein [Armatimonas rosea]